MNNVLSVPRTGLVPAALQHDAYWAISEQHAHALIAQLQAIDPTRHLAEYRAQLAEIEARRPGDAADAKPFDFGSDGIAHLYLYGTLTKSPGSMERGTSTVYVRRLLRMAAADPDVRAILVHVDSPGGTVSGTDDLARDVADANRRKPVCVYIEDLCASAALWVSSMGSALWANPTALVGSIGTVMAIYDYSRMAENEGIRVHVVSTGPHKGAGIPGSQITDEQLAEFQRVVDQLNAHFLENVAAGRGMDIERVRSIADGRVHVARSLDGGEDALSLGLIDEVMTIDEAVARCRAMSGSPATGARADADPPGEPQGSDETTSPDRRRRRALAVFAYEAARPTTPLPRQETTTQ